MVGTNVWPFHNSYTSKTVQLINENASYHNIKHKTTIEEFNQFLDEPGEEIRENTFVVLDGEKVIAYQSLCFIKSDEFINVYSYGTVHYQYRRQGIGSLLLTHTLMHLKERAEKENIKIIYNHMVWLNIDGQNQLAIKFKLAKYTDLLSYNWRKSNIPIPLPVLPKGYSFKRPTTEDAEYWAKIDNEAFSWRKNKSEIQKENVIFEFNSLEFSPDFYILCLNERREPVGFICGKEEGPQRGVISTLAVLPDYQGVGIGKALLSEIMNRMQEHDINHIRLSVDANNPTSAIQLYEKSGFKMGKRIIHYIYEMDPRKGLL
ncbi:N-acetyltransferase [Bacillus sp. FJAT-49736]|uniref:GNAT family N-acetyltransferase n=1 Tax=Bacillus sp. FJAT-49736 TaxID=2833582 RepID=UPI001BC94D77|nr:N-acetyltransferase [Bacillus sp. FJAT-49736]MBS4174941.1 GNAT family N-acetyltransferase [Bacillus sp. FJAT-49736]